jgi:hypothetical protein
MNVVDMHSLQTYPDLPIQLGGLPTSNFHGYQVGSYNSVSAVCTCDC